jgi:hypothetical protein
MLNTPVLSLTQCCIYFICAALSEGVNGEDASCLESGQRGIDVGRVALLDEGPPPETEEQFKLTWTHLSLSSSH